MKSNAALHILRHAKRIALVRTDRLGDMVLTLPLARTLKENFPQASIEMITRSYTAPLIENIPLLASVHYVDRKPLRDILHDEDFDVVFFPRMKSEECFAAFRARVPLRVGSGYRWYSWMLSFRIKQHRKTAERHEAEYNVGMVEAIMGKRITPQLVRPFVHDEARREVQRLLQAEGIAPNERWIVIHPGSGGSARDWMPERFGKAAQHIAEQKGMRVVITGIENEGAKCQRAIQECPDAVNLCGKLDLRLMIALLEQTSLLLANSTGVLHIAAALGTPVLGFYPNSPALSAKRWGPYSANSSVLSPPPHSDPRLADDMGLISVESAIQHAFLLLD